MTKTESFIAQAYSAFNQRNIDGALALMSDSVSWPKASEGGRVVGKDEIRAYWSRQWIEFDPHVDPLEVLDQGAGRIHVRVHQLVKSLSGDVLSDSEVWHVYTISNAWSSEKAKRIRSNRHPRRSPGARHRPDICADPRDSFVVAGRFVPTSRLVSADSGRITGNSDPTVAGLL
jgi:hypothetical protein